MEQVFGIISFYINCPKAFRGFALLCKKAALCCHNLQAAKKIQFSKTIFTEEISLFTKYLISVVLPNGHKHGKEFGFYTKKERDLYISKGYCLDYDVKYYENNELEKMTEIYVKGAPVETCEYKRGLKNGKKVMNDINDNFKLVNYYRDGKESILFRIYIGGIISSEEIWLNELPILKIFYNRNKKLYKKTHFYYHINDNFREGIVSTSFIFDESGNKIDTINNLY